MTERNLALVSPSLKALQKVKAATEVGINFRDYGNLVVEAKAAVNEAIVTLTDQDLKAAVQGAMEAYADALTAWNLSIQAALNPYGSGLDLIVVSHPEGRRLHNTYHFALGGID